MAGAAMPPRTRAAAITAGTDTTVEEEVTIRAGSTRVEATTMVDASGLVLILASGSASRSAGVTIRVTVAATTTATATGSRLPAIRISTRVTDRVRRIESAREGARVAVRTGHSSLRIFLCQRNRRPAEP